MCLEAGAGEMQPASLSEWCFLEVPLRKHTQAPKEVRGRDYEESVLKK